MSKGALIRGSAPPSAWIDGVNLSAATRSRQTISDTRCLAKADINGRFECRLLARVRDVLRLRWRRANGSVGEWVEVRVPEGGRTRPPQVATFRIGTILTKAGRVQLVNISNTRPIAVPECKLCVVNRRTRLPVMIHLNAKGNFRPHTMVTAEPGDVLDIYGLCQRWIKAGRIEVPRPVSAGLPKIAPFHGARRAVFGAAAVREPVFAGRPVAADVVQGDLSNCHLAAAVAAVAHAWPGAIVLKACGRSYEAILFLAGRRRRILVDRELYRRPSGELLFGRNDFGQHKRPAWWPLLEKAFAVALGGYDALERGGTAPKALHMVTGLPACYRMLSPANERRHWGDLVRALAAGSPVVASTRTSPTGYRNTGIENDHCYTVLSCREHQDRRWVRLRNPWGEMTPSGVRRWGDGVFEIQWLSFVRHFSELSFLDMGHS